MAQAVTPHKNKLSASFLLTFFGLYATATQADWRVNKQKAGMVRVATFDANPLFGSIEAKTRILFFY
ncbi:hypothetical protein [Cedecea colo]|uniref:hypothetical protein n=1 Tax=Cedecea colo TaxID=2552946 RepID=UPI003B83244B